MEQLRENFCFIWFVVVDDLITEDVTKQNQNKRVPLIGEFPLITTNRRKTDCRV